MWAEFIETWQGIKEIEGVGVDSIKVDAAAYSCAAVLDRYNPNDKELELILEKIPDTWKTPEYK